MRANTDLPATASAVLSEIPIYAPPRKRGRFCLKNILKYLQRIRRYVIMLFRVAAMNIPKLHKPTKRQVLKFLRYALIVILGNAITAAASAFIIIPNDFTMGGTTGLGLFVRNLTNKEWAVTLTVYAANIALFILGAVLLGKKFAVATLAGTLLYPSFLSLWQFVNGKLGSPFLIRPVEGFTTDINQPLLGVIFGALFFGLGIGIVVRVGASTGGTDVPPLILHKYFNFPVSAGMWILDISIVLLQFAANVGMENILYGVLIMMISSFIVDKVSMIGTKRAQVKILSKKHEEIRKLILNKLNRGVTLLNGKTGFLKDDCYMILTIVSFRDVVKLRNAVQKIDPEALFMVSTISEVRGRGFSSNRVVLPRTEEKDVSPEDMQEVSPPETNNLKIPPKGETEEPAPVDRDGTQAE